MTPHFLKNSYGNSLPLYVHRDVSVPRVTCGSVFSRTQESNRKLHWYNLLLICINEEMYAGI
jgi:hypothetical protein